VIGEDTAAVVGKPFNPESMEAVMRQPITRGFHDGDVTKVLRCGYCVADCLVRAALVVVACDE
jgi:molecular chaperone GrpE (heat shock protein)